MTDLALWEMWVSKRDANAFQQILLRHADMVYATCCRVLRNRSEAEDVTQECFQRLAATETGPTQHLPAWLHRVAVNLCLNRQKSEARRKEREARFAAEMATDATVEWNEVYGLIDEALMELPEELRAPILSHFFEHQSHAAIAEVSGVSRRTITYRIEKGIEALREKLNSRGVGVATAALAAGLGDYTFEAAPEALKAHLAKIALSGAPRITTMAVAAKPMIGSLGLKLAAGLAAVLVTGGFAINQWWFSENPENLQPIQVLTPPPAAQPPGPVTHVVETAPAVKPPSSPSTSAANVDPGASLEGTVTSPGGMPVANAHVEVRRQLERGKQQRIPFRIPFGQPEIAATTETDANGVFSVGDLPSGEKLMCVIRHPDWGVDIRVLKELHPRQDLKTTFRLAPKTRIEGDVITEAGEPVQEARVWVWCSYGASHKPASEEVQDSMAEGQFGAIIGGQTDGNGKFDIDGLKENEAIMAICAEAPSFAPSFAWAAEKTARAFLKLPCAPVNITLQRGIRVSGKIAGADGTPVPNARVRLCGEITDSPQIGIIPPYAGAEGSFCGWFPYSKETVSDASGAYCITGVCPTIFGISAVSEGMASESVKQVPRVIRDIENVNLAMRPMGVITGTVFSVETGKPMVAKLYAQFLESEFGDALTDTTDSLGHFCFENCRSGRWGIMPEDLHDLSMLLPKGSRALDTLEVNVKPGQESNVEIYLQLRQNTEGTIEGRILRFDGTPAANAEVMGDSGGSATANERGEYVLEHLSLRKTKVTAIDAATEMFGTGEVEVEAGQQEYLDVTLTEPAAIGTGSIYGKDGKLYTKPVQLRLDLDGWRARFITAEKGHFETGPVPSGQHAIRVQTPGLTATPDDRGGVVEAGERVEGLDFVVEPMESMVSGVVVYPGGAPAANIELELRGQNLHKSGATDDNGRFAFAQAGGEFSMTVGHPPTERSAGDSVWAMVRFDAAEANDIKIVLQPLGRVTAQVTAENEDALPMSVKFFTMSNDVFVETVVPDDGKLAISLPPNTYVLNLVSLTRDRDMEPFVLMDIVVESGKTTGLGPLTLLERTQEEYDGESL